MAATANPPPRKTIQITIPSLAEVEQKFRGSRLGAAVTAYGFIHLGLIVLSRILGWKSDIEEAVTTAQQIAPEVGKLMALIASPWFGLLFALLGIGYVIFVPTEAHPKSRFIATTAAAAAFALGLSALLVSMSLVFAMRMTRIPQPANPPSSSAGFLQSAGAFIPANIPCSLEVGKTCSFNIEWINPTPTRVFNFYGVAHLDVMDVTPHTDHDVRAGFATIAAPQQESYKAGKISGPEIVFNELEWITLTTPSFTSAQIDGIRKGTTRIYITDWYAWTYTKDEPFRIDSGDDCRWLQAPIEPIRNETLVWHHCTY